LNVTARDGSNTLVLQPDLHKFDAIYKEMEENVFSLTSARVPTCPAERVVWNVVKIKGKEKDESVQGVKQRDND
jgi:hypothetical protein